MQWRRSKNRVAFRRFLLTQSTLYILFLLEIAFPSKNSRSAPYEATHVISDSDGSRIENFATYAVCNGEVRNRSKI